MCHLGPQGTPGPTFGDHQVLYKNVVLANFSVAHIFFEHILILGNLKATSKLNLATWSSATSPGPEGLRAAPRNSRKYPSNALEPWGRAQWGPGQPSSAGWPGGLAGLPPSRLYPNNTSNLSLNLILLSLSTLACSAPRGAAARSSAATPAPRGCPRGSRCRGPPPRSSCRRRAKLYVANFD